MQIKTARLIYKIFNKIKYLKYFTLTAFLGRLNQHRQFLLKQMNTGNTLRERRAIKSTPTSLVHFKDKRLYILSCLISFFLIIACDAQNIRRTTITETTHSSSHPIITLEHFRTCKSCPAYQVLIFADGEVIYIGKDFVNVHGIQHGRLNLNQLKSLIAIAESLQFESLSETYVGQWLDASLISISYNRLSIKKSVKFQPVVGGAPSGLDHLANLIDSTVGTFRWICPVPQANELVCGPRKKAFDAGQGEIN